MNIIRKSYVLTDLLKIAMQLPDIVKHGIPEIGFSKLRSPARCVKRLSVINRPPAAVLTLSAPSQRFSSTVFVLSLILISNHLSTFPFTTTCIDWSLRDSQTAGNSIGFAVCNRSGKLKFRVSDPRVRYYKRIVRVKAKRWNSLSIWPLTSHPSGENNTSVMK